MKNTTLAFILSLLFASFASVSSFAQTWADSTVAVPPDVFPIGGFTFGGVDSINNLKSAGMNLLHIAKFGNSH